jgi:tripartite-type tricarboxylate transporter receptor subunit TctC
MAIPATFAASVALFRKLPFRPVDDFTMVSMTAEFPYVLVTYSDHSIRTMADLIRTARSQSAPLTYGTSGVGSLQHLTVEHFANLADVKLQHVPYRGGALPLRSCSANASILSSINRRRLSTSSEMVGSARWPSRAGSDFSACPTLPRFRRQVLWDSM